MKSSWQRVTHKNRCPICDHCKGCLISADSSAVICVRTGSQKQVGGAGWLHRLTSDKRQFTPKTYTVSASPLATQSHGDEAEAFHRWALDHRHLTELSDRLKVSEDSLRRLLVGHSSKERFWTFPLSDADGKIIGINRRFGNGEKKLMKGHKAGLYLPRDLSASLKGEKLLICEGGTDTAAALGLGFHAVGRFSCSHGAKLLVSLIRRVSPASVVIVSDTDEVGRRGAESLAAVLLVYTRVVKVIEPPAKDLREWVAGGATREDVEALIAAVPLRRISVKVRSA